jgi:hypothetical protein
MNYLVAFIFLILFIIAFPKISLFILGALWLA